MIKSEYVESGSLESYPIIGISKTKSTIVLFTDEGVGAVLNDPAGDFDPGYFADDWEPTNFQEFKGTVSLTQ